MTKSRIFIFNTKSTGISNFLNSNKLSMTLKMICIFVPYKALISFVTYFSAFEDLRGCISITSLFLF